MKKTLKSAGGHFVQVEHEMGDDYYVVTYVPGTGVDLNLNDRAPFVIRKDNEDYTEQPIEPQAGDIWVSRFNNEYRVLGVVPGKQMLIVPRRSYADGKWPTAPTSGETVQEDAVITETTNVYIRRLPEKYLTFKERP